MMKLLPIGTVVERKGRKLLLIGYGAAAGKECTSGGYYAVVYPIGFISMEKLLFLPADCEFSVISRGMTDETSEKLLVLMGETLNAAEKEPAELVREAWILRDVLHRLKKEGHNGADRQKFTHCAAGSAEAGALYDCGISPLAGFRWYPGLFWRPISVGTAGAWFIPMF